MISRSFIVKIAENFSEKNFSWKFLTVTNRKKIEIISLSYDVNDHVYSKSKSV